MSPTGRHQIAPIEKSKVQHLSELQKHFDLGFNSVSAAVNQGGTSPATHIMFAAGDERICPRPRMTCRDSRFRSEDGSCNNLKSPRLGMSLECLQRLVDAEFADGRSVPRESFSGRALPSARAISLRLHQHVDSPASVTQMAMIYGQFLDHDISQSPIAQSDGPIRCCEAQGTKHPECMEITIPKRRPLLLAVQSALHELRPLSHLFELSTGRDETDALRLLDGSGRLKVTRTRNAGDLLPRSPDPNSDQCSVPEDNQICFKAGDVRVNQQVPLVAMHTIFMRQHNRIAGMLKSMNKEWREERIFQETRRILGAQMQMITYNEFVPLMIGDTYYDHYDLRVGKASTYRPDLNPRIFDEFSTAAYRFGHSLVGSTFNRLFSDGRKESFALRDNFFNPFPMYNGDLDSVMRGLVGTKAERPDPFFEDDVRGHLYKVVGTRFGLDLVAINIQRGRDHGLPPYTKYLEFCFSDHVTSFQDLDRYMPADQREKYQRGYESVHDIDLFSGGISELPMPGALVGPTFGCIIGFQFSHLKFGDRYYFEHANQTGSFTPAQLKSIRQTLLSKIVCENGDKFSSIHKKVLTSSSNSDPVVDCSKIPDINLAAWKE
ncbi:Peroxidasin [Halotydeus destructor]|nr:Peroxidasin [Halotydeus destructor]